MILYVNMTKVLAVKQFLIYSRIPIQMNTVIIYHPFVKELIQIHKQQLQKQK